MNRLVIGLGNPGKEYEWTRHNVGMLVVKAYAETKGLTFHSEKGCLASVAKGEDERGKIFVAYLTTYMNESGKAGARLLKFLQVDVKNVLVVFDDIETDWGQAKVVTTGGTRGHNGIRSLQALLGSKDFSQLRVGVGHPGGGDVAEYVLDRFSAEELGELPAILEQTGEKVSEWLENLVCEV